MKKAFITGVTGQDGSYLAEFLLAKGYQVHSIIRRSSVFTSKRIRPETWNNKNFKTYHGDLTDSSNLHSLLLKIKPDEVYNLAAQSHVAVSFQVPEYTGEVDGIGTLRLLNAIKDLGIDTKFYQASTSEMFGGLKDSIPQNENTPFYPKSPYGAAKLYAHWLTINYRESYNIFACNGILFNHESPRRGKTFVTKKITMGVSKIKKGVQDVLKLGNLDAMRDWGYAKEYVEVMWQMLQQEKPNDFVIATGKFYSIRNFVTLAFKYVDIDLEWKGEGVNEVGVDKKTGKILVQVDPKYFRPSEVEFLLGDPTKANKILNWKNKTSIEELVKIMMEYDLNFDDYGYD